MFDVSTSFHLDVPVATASTAAGQLGGPLEGGLWGDMKDELREATSSGALCDTSMEQGF